MKETIAFLRRTKPTKIEIAPRIIAAVPLILFGVAHYFEPAPFVTMLRAAGIPAVGLNVVLAPAAEIVAGLMLLTGLFARLGGILATSTMVVALYSHFAVPPAAVAMPPISLPLAVLASSLFIAWRGAGRWSLDSPAIFD